MRTILIVLETTHATIRSEVWGWTVEDTDCFIPNKPIGYSGHPKENYMYTTVFEALYHGFRLLAPPTRNIVNTTVSWEWWLTKEIK